MIIHTRSAETMKLHYPIKPNYLLPLVSLALFFAGCGGLCPVTGKVMFEDAAPLTKGVVTFQSPSYVTKGTLDPSGNYSLKVPPGEYTVYIPFASRLDTTFVPPPDEPDAARYINLIDEKFASASSSPLKCSVKSRKRFDITVEPPK